MKTKPPAASLAKNVPPLVREYIDARFDELTQAIDRRFTNLRRINMSAIKTVKEIREDAANAIGSIDREARRQYVVRRKREEKPE